MVFGHHVTAGAWASRHSKALGSTPRDLVEGSEAGLVRVLAELPSWLGRELNPGQ